MTDKKVAKAEDEQDGVTLSSLQAALEKLTDTVAKLAARAEDGEKSGDEDDDKPGDGDEDTHDGDARGADDGDGDESKDGETENRGAGKARKIGKAYAIAVMDMCALAGLGEMASGFVARGEKMDVVRRKLLAARKTHEAGRTSNNRSGEKSTADAVASSWDAAIAKVYPKIRK